MPILRGRIGGQWVDIGVVQKDEVWIGPDDPLAADPTGTWELWYEPDSVPPMLHALVGGVWVDCASPDISEVFVGPDDPYAINPLQATDELWFDTDAVPPTLFARDVATSTWVSTAAAAIDEVWIGPDEPVDPAIELWFDTDDQGTVPPEYPAGGDVDQALVKLSNLSNDVGWGGPHLQLVGGTVTGPLIYSGAVHLVLTAAGIGVQLAGGAILYERSGVPVLRESTGGAQPQIENNDGTAQRDIIDTVNGDLRYALKAEGGVVGGWQNCAWGLSGAVLGGSYAQWRDLGGSIGVKFNIETGQGMNALGPPLFTVSGPKPHNEIRFWGRDPYSGASWMEYQCLTNGQVTPLNGLTASRHLTGSFIYPKP